MSAITRAIQHVQMVKDIEELKAGVKLLNENFPAKTLAQLPELFEAIDKRITALEQKRGPGRPKNEDRKPDQP